MGILFVHKENNYNDLFNNSSPLHLLRCAAIMKTVSQRMRLLPHHVNNACAWCHCLCNVHMHQQAHASFT